MLVSHVTDFKWLPRGKCPPPPPPLPLNFPEEKCCKLGVITLFQYATLKRGLRGDAINVEVLLIVKKYVQSTRHPQAILTKIET